MPPSLLRFKVQGCIGAARSSMLTVEGLSPGSPEPLSDYEFPAFPQLNKVMVRSTTTNVVFGLERQTLPYPKAVQTMAHVQKSESQEEVQCVRLGAFVSKPQA